MTTIGGDFFFNGILRKNWGFASPNLAGGAIAIAMTFIRATFYSFKKMAVTDLATTATLAACATVEIVLWWMLCKTYSRGAVVAALFTLLFQGILVFLRYGRRMNPITAFAIGSALLWIVRTNVVARLKLVASKTDDSINNRWKLYTGALDMMTSKPLAGWGVNRSGSMFTQWFEKPDMHQSYATMVNGFLTFGVEFGAFLEFLLVCAVLTIVVAPYIFLREADSWRVDSIYCLSASLLTLALVDSFSTLCTNQELVCLCVVCTAVYIALAWPFRGAVLSSLATVVTLVALLTIVLGHGARNRLKKENTFVIDPVNNRIVELKSTGTDFASAPVTWMFVDERALGPLYGQRIRHMLLGATAFRMFVFDDSFRGDIPASVPNPDRIVLVGKHVQRAGEFSGKCRILMLIEPTIVAMPPRSYVPVKIRALITRLDPDGGLDAWKDFLHGSLARIYEVDRLDDSTLGSFIFGSF